MSEQEESKAKSGPLGGLLHSLTRVVATLVAMAQTRLELLTTELQEEIHHAAAVLLWAFVALFAAGIGLFLLALAAIFAYWDTHRVLVSVLVTLAFFVIAAIAALCLRKLLHRRSRLLVGTLSELARDKQHLEERMQSRL
jgi:uncharacterized membrane protein YqjE